MFSVITKKRNKTLTIAKKTRATPKHDNVLCFNRNEGLKQGADSKSSESTHDLRTKKHF
jgi:hypothetical protein